MKTPNVQQCFLLVGLIPVPAVNVERFQFEFLPLLSAPRDFSEPGYRPFAVYV